MISNLNMAWLLPTLILLCFSAFSLGQADDENNNWEPCHKHISSVIPDTKWSCLGDINDDERTVRVECVTGKRWLSFEKNHTRQFSWETWEGMAAVCSNQLSCQRQKREEIWKAFNETKDECVDEHPIPVNCSSLQDLGINKTGDYKVIFSGLQTESQQMIKCDLETSDGRWTVLGVGTTSDFEHSATDIPTWNNDGGYFIGLRNMISLTRWNDTELPVVLEVIIQDSDGRNETVSYSDFLLDDNGTLNKSGNFHGLAANALCPYVGTKWNHTTLYWGGLLGYMEPNDSSQLFSVDGNGAFRWGKQTDLTTLTFRVRSKHHDQQHRCPPAIGIDNTWQLVNTDESSIDRVEGAVINYKCKDPLYVEGFDRQPEDRLRQGSVNCVNDTLGLHWDKNISLPCTIKCPENFTVSLDGTFCLHASEEGVSSIMEASQECFNLDSTLAVVPDGSHNSLMEYKFYFTAWDFRFHESTMASFEDLSGPLTNYGNRIYGSKYYRNKCALAYIDDGTNDLLFWECFSKTDKFPYLCAYPGTCPADFIMSKKRRGCYSWLPSLENDVGLISAAEECNKRASSLPMPVNEDQLEDLIDIMMNAPNATYNQPKQLFLGFFINASSGVWNTEEFNIDVDPSIKQLMEGFDEQYRILSVHNRTYEIDSATRETPLQGWVLCQLHGPPTVCDSTKLDWNISNAEVIENSDNNFNTTTIVKCNRGYFVNGNQSVIVQESTCLGYLGGWQPTSFQPCEKVEVCAEAADVFDPVRIQDFNTTDSKYLDGIIRYDCPANMSTMSNGDQQYLQCRENLSFPEDPKILFPIGFTYKIINSTNDTFQKCDICVGAPEGDNIQADPSIENTQIGHNVTSECLDGYKVNLTSTSQIRTCTETGWEPENMTCYKACPEETPDAVHNMTKGPITSNAVGTVVEYSCIEGWYIDGKEKQLDIGPILFLVCNSSGAWEVNATDIDEISEVQCLPACTKNVTKGSETLKREDAIPSVRINATLFFHCTQGLYITPTMENPELATNYSLTCQTSGEWELNGRKETPSECVNVTTVDPLIPTYPQVEFNWDNYTRTLGTKINYTCPAATGGFAYDGSYSITLEATADGWEPNMTPESLRCLQVCSTSPPEPGMNMLWDNTTDIKNRVEGIIFNYTCKKGTYLPKSLGYPENLNSTSATCNSQLEWIPEYPNVSLECHYLCVDNPPEANNALMNWDNETRFNGTSILYRCPTDTLFGNFESEWNVTCNISQWEKVDKELFNCTKGCHTAAPPLIGNAIKDSTTKFGKEGDTLTYTCPDGGVSETGINQVNITCTNQTWSDPPENFTCIPAACPCPPPPPGANVTYNFSIVCTEGQVIKYECLLDWFEGGNKMIYNRCENKTWTTKVIPDCGKCLFF